MIHAFVSIFLLFGFSLTAFAAEEDLFADDFQHPEIRLTDNKRPYAVPEGWRASGLVRMGHPLGTAPGSRQVAMLVKGRIEKDLPDVISPESFYYIYLRMRDNKSLLPSHFEATLYARSDEGELTELLNFGAGDEGVSHGHALPLESGEWQVQTALWYSGLHSGLVGQDLVFAIEGQRVELHSLHIKRGEGAVPSLGPWVQDSHRLEEDPDISGYSPSSC